MNYPYNLCIGRIKEQPHARYWQKDVGQYDKHHLQKIDPLDIAKGISIATRQFDKARKIAFFEFGWWFDFLETFILPLKKSVYGRSMERPLRTPNSELRTYVAAIKSFF